MKVKSGGISRRSDVAICMDLLSGIVFRRKAEVAAIRRFDRTKTRFPMSGSEQRAKIEFGFCMSSRLWTYLFIADSGLSYTLLIPGQQLQGPSKPRKYCVSVRFGMSGAGPITLLLQS